jgi:CRISPR system Cascade subunit CasD
MATLLLQCVAPLQSWGTQSEYLVRDTGREPSKSGIIGLLCAALGRGREQPLDDLAELTMAVRVDQEGKILRDYHTITDKTRNTASTVVSTRYYLADAMFLVALEGQIDILRQLQSALKHPRWNLFLGRKSCVPSRPPYLPHGLLEDSLLVALREYPWLGQDRQRYEKTRSLRLIYEDMDVGNEFHRDNPVSFVRNERLFHPRRTTTMFVLRPDFDPQKSYPYWLIQDGRVDSERRQ